MTYSHIAEEIPHAQRNLPIAIAVRTLESYLWTMTLIIQLTYTRMLQFQMGFGFITGLAFVAQLSIAHEI